MAHLSPPPSPPNSLPSVTSKLLNYPNIMNGLDKLNFPLATSAFRANLNTALQNKLSQGKCEYINPFAWEMRRIVVTFWEKWEWFIEQRNPVQFRKLNAISVLDSVNCFRSLLTHFTRSGDFFPVKEVKMDGRPFMSVYREFRFWFDKHLTHKVPDYRYDTYCASILLLCFEIHFRC